MPRGRNKVWLESSPGGIRGDLNPATIPKGEWLSSSNMLVRNGVTVPRPGYAQLNSTLASADKIIGIEFFDTPITTGTHLIIQTQTKAYSYAGGITTDITGTWASSTTRCALVPWDQGGTRYIVRVNTVNDADKSDAGTAAFTDCTGAPSGTDACVVRPYFIIGFPDGGSSNVQWCEANDIDSWPAANVANIASTAHRVGNAVRAIDSRSFALWGYQELWVGALQAAKTAFQFMRVAKINGPILPGAVCETPQGFFWMAIDGAIYNFDGARVEEISTAAVKSVESGFATSIDPISSAYFPGDNPEVWWFGQDWDFVAKTAICLNLKTRAVTVHTLQHAVHAATGGNLYSSTSERGLVIGSSDGKYYSFGNGVTDAGTAIPWNFEYGYVPTCDNVNESGEIDAVASYWKKTSSSCTVTVSLTPSDSISDDETAYTDTFDTSAATSNHSKAFRGKQGKWAKLKFSGTSVVADLEYRGALLTSWQRSMT